MHPEEQVDPDGYNTGRCTVQDRTGGVFEFTGRLLGYGTSRRDSHLHPKGQFPGRGIRCSGCRWTEVAIYWSDDDDSYVLHVAGISEVPGESSRDRAVWASDPGEIMESLLLPSKRDPEVFELPAPNLEAIQEAGERDPDLARVLLQFQGRWSTPPWSNRDAG